MGGCHFFSFFITLQFNHIYCVCGESKVPLLLFRSSVFWVSHTRFSSKSLLFQNLISFVHFWSSMVVVYKNCWLLYLSLLAIHRKVNGRFFFSYNLRNIIFYKATKSIAKIKNPLLQNFINQNAKKLLKRY